MQPSPPREVASRHGLEQSQELPVAAGQHRQDLEQREDMRLAHSSVKIMRTLCRDYGIDVAMPLHSSAYGTAKSGHASGDSSSSSSSDVEERQEDAESFARWPDVKDLIDGLQTGKRVTVLKEISKSLNDSASRAEQSIKEFDARTVGAGSKDDEGNQEGDVVNEDLLRFDPSKTPAAEAVKRCQAMMPELRQLAMAQAEATKASMQRALKEAEVMSAEAAAAVSDSEASGTEKQDDIERKFQQLGELPVGAHPDLQLVLELQREEIRATVQRIKEGERDLQIKKCALEYVDGKLSMMEGDQELLNACISMAQEMKASIYTRQKEEAEKKMEQDHRLMNIPTDLEVQEQVAESERLKREVHAAQEQVRRLQEMSVAMTSNGGNHDEGVSIYSRRSSMQSQSEGEEKEQEGEEGEKEAEKEESEKPDGGEEEGAEQKPERKRERQKSQVIYVQEGNEGAVGRVVVDLARVPEVHLSLTKQAAALEEQIAAEDKRIAHAEGIMKNAEQTLKVLEEAKTLLLEHVARERPALIEGLLPATDKPDEHAQSDDEGDSSLASSKDEGDEEDAAEHLHSLASEELRIRSELAEAAEPAEGNSTSEEEGERTEEKEEEEQREKEKEDVPAKPKKDYGERCTRGLQRLARRLREDADSGAVADTEAAVVSDSSSASSNSPRVWTPPPELTREEAISQLRSMPHEELQTLLRLRNDNERLMKQIDRARREIEQLRVKQGNPKALLAADDPEQALGEGVSPELVAEVRQKVRELCALRKRWWHDRQDPSTTVRRSLAAMNLPTDAETEDQPPLAAQGSLFKRIHASMTMP